MQVVQPGRLRGEEGVGGTLGRLLPQLPPGGPGTWKCRKQPPTGCLQLAPQAARGGHELWTLSHAHTHSPDGLQATMGKALGSWDEG